MQNVPTVSHFSGFLRKNCDVYSFSEFNVVLSLCLTQDVCCAPVRGGSMVPPGNHGRNLGEGAPYLVGGTFWLWKVEDRSGKN